MDLQKAATQAALRLMQKGTNIRFVVMGSTLRHKQAPNRSRNRNSETPTLNR